ncbi:MAG: hypothetical protein A2X49_13690 [Lentisphaerae bacterium GWF2_52_8]|nr:MAG: hypothetical protein A2X49_13690 [Lentisphaerae bacterium GWF2_52_8]
MVLLKKEINQTSNLIAREIRAQIGSGVLKAGDKLLPEKDLVVFYSTTPHQVRKALSVLKQEGIIETIPKQGVFVSQKLSLSSVTAEKPAPVEACTGFSITDMIGHIKPNLKFAIVAWNMLNKPLWDRLCAEFSARYPVTIEPVYVSLPQEYYRALLDCEIVMSSPSRIFSSASLMENIYWWPLSEARQVPITEKHLRTVMGINGVGGIPVLGNLISGLLNSRKLSPSAITRLHQTKGWGEVLEILSSLTAPRHSMPGININANRTLNLCHFLTLNAGSLLDSGRKSLNLRRPDILHALELLEQYRGKAFPRGAENEDYLGNIDPEEYLLTMNFICNYPRIYKDKPHLIPWLHPLGAAGNHLEDINIVTISNNCICIEEAKHFVRFLLSESVQRQFASIPAEYPVSSEIAEPFAGYPESWRKILSAIKENTTCLYDEMPGYCQVFGQVLYPLSRKFAEGEISKEELVSLAEKKGNSLLQQYEKSVQLAVNA